VKMERHWLYGRRTERNVNGVAEKLARQGVWDGTAIPGAGDRHPVRDGTRQKAVFGEGEPVPAGGATS
jgi:hypothetical protein